MACHVFEDEFEKFIREEARSEFEKEFASKATEELQEHVYEHIINFFSRYYDRGVFELKSNATYDVRLNGEQITLYWPHRDQYYVKTAEYIKDHSFEIDNLKINFKVLKAEVEKGDVKPPEKKFFVLAEQPPRYQPEENELTIFFEYRRLTDSEKQQNEPQGLTQTQINKHILAVVDNILANEPVWTKKSNKAAFEKQLNKFTKNVVRSYFIHKNLRAFLQQELETYISKELLTQERLEQIFADNDAEHLKQYLAIVRIFKNVAMKIINILADIEDFKKKLWEKKKFVLETHYVITLDKIAEYAGEEFLNSIIDEILSNEEQLREWKELFGIEVKSKEDLYITEKDGN